jgi:hypothetical protein
VTYVKFLLLTAALLIKSRRTKWVEQVACIQKRNGAYRVSMGHHDGTKSLRKLRLRLEDNIKMDLKEVEWGHGLD